ncbi:type II toxin-antitoxin system VapC family toxin [Sphaerisporangium rhizosphaerae]|uniref:Type II toxin-antitoxin system VapC family toxin n=1 Tax=Sphaerisporangium rhizosphaerae TaxID=2269375 RepID=A0ABW2NYB1_9ACTN
MKELLIDSGPLIATYSPGDVHHVRCSRLLASWPGPVVVPEPVLVETCGFVRNNFRRGADYEAQLLDHMSSGSGPFKVVMTTHEDLLRVAQLVRQMANAPMGYVDAAVIAMAERLHITDVATVDTKLVGMSVSVSKIKPISWLLPDLS